MTQISPSNLQITIRPVQYRDLEAVERLYSEGFEADGVGGSIDPDRPLKYLQLRPWHGLHRVLNLLLNPLQYMFCASIPEQGNKIRGVIRVSPFNRTRSTWRVDRVAVDDSLPVGTPAVSQENSSAEGAEIAPSVRKLSFSEIGSQLLRHCLDTIWEARTWLLEVNVNDKDSLALYRENGFQPLAQMTYWEITPKLLQELAEREPDLPNLLPVSNADAQLLYQLDTASMPPLVRQVFDRHILDFKTSLLGSLMDGLKHWLSHTEVVSGYVFEPQRKAAIGYFQLKLCRDSSKPHQGQLTVHPAYTWLYPELLSQMARITQDLPAQSLQLASSDYQPEREEYLDQLGATRIAHTLMMSRSVWHKVRETKPTALEGLQLPEVLQGLKPARKPVPSRITLLSSVNQSSQTETSADTGSALRQNGSKSETNGQGTKRSLKLPVSRDFSDPPQEGPCC
ncbi:MAG: GNAT family N-acetyltransferase [Leptolyngbyaceae cyanobacterium HOT.MB2.61]|nr:GNAT family N-acetyltransferase [Leptolyngbyaceae cyanobacterium HOT.MB2.61]